MSISPINTGQTKFYAENFSVNVLAASVGTVIATYIVPSKCRARLLSFGNYLSLVALWGDVTWRMNVNGIPMAPYNAIRDQIGYAAQRSDVEKIEAGGGSVITVTADNADALLAVDVGVSLAWELIFQE